MPTITIPKKISTNEDLIAVPRKEYEKLFRFWESAERLTTRERRAVVKGFREISEGKVFSSGQVRHELEL